MDRVGKQVQGQLDIKLGKTLPAYITLKKYEFVELATG